MEQRLVIAVAASLRKALGVDARMESAQCMTGGDSHRAMKLRYDDRDWFIKIDRAGALPLFQTELRGLQALAKTGCLAVPQAVVADADHSHAWLALPHESLRGAGDAAALGAGLACLHRHSAASHGWCEDNFLGRTRQFNPALDDWTDFWWRRRLLPQLDLAAVNGFGATLSPLADRLRRACEHRLSHAPPPSLLHGDLWGGNHGYRPGGTPIIFDPAPWFGDRETDLAMMRLFGGFDPEVFRAYERAWPLPPGAEERVGLYQLYHLLNHLNLFGGGWLGRVESTARALV